MAETCRFALYLTSHQLNGIKFMNLIVSLLNKTVLFLYGFISRFVLDFYVNSKIIDTYKESFLLYRLFEISFCIYNKCLQGIRGIDGHSCRNTKLFKYSHKMVDRISNHADITRIKRHEFFHDLGIVASVVAQDVGQVSLQALHVHVSPMEFRWPIERRETVGRKSDEKFPKVGESVEDISHDFTTGIMRFEEENIFDWQLAGRMSKVAKTREMMTILNPLSLYCRPEVRNWRLAKVVSTKGNGLRRRELVVHQLF